MFEKRRAQQIVLTEHHQNIPRYTNHITITKGSLVPRSSHRPVFDCNTLPGILQVLQVIKNWMVGSGGSRTLLLGGGGGGGARVV